MKLSLRQIGSGSGGSKLRKAFVRRSGRIEKKSLRKFKNTANDPIILEDEENSKKIEIESEAFSPKTLDFSGKNDDDKPLVSMVRSSKDTGTDFGGSLKKRKKENTKVKSKKRKSLKVVSEEEEFEKKKKPKSDTIVSPVKKNKSVERGEWVVYVVF